MSSAAVWSGRRRISPRGGPVCAAEAAGSYTARGAAATGDRPTGPAAGLAAAVERVVGRSVDELDVSGLRAELTLIDRQVRRLQARVSELAGALACRRAADAAAARPADPRAGERAARQTRQDLARQLRWTPSHTARTLDVARRLELLPSSRAAYRDGALTPDHARVLTQTLDLLDGTARATAERTLLEAAEVEDAVAFGRTCRRLLRRIVPDVASEQAHRRHGRRHLRLAQTPDGMTVGSLALAGLDAEVLHTAVDAYRTHDGPDDRRTSQQRSADALVAALKAALDHGLNPTGRGRGPHIQVLITWEQLLASQPDGTVPWTGELDPAEVRRLLDSSTISRLLTGPDSLPLDSGRATRTVSPGIWRALVARDRGCTWEGCDAPPGWCQSAHLDRRWAAGAGISVDELALACPRHHLHIDRHRLVGRLHEGRVVWRPPD